MKAKIGKHTIETNFVYDVIETVEIIEHGNSRRVIHIINNQMRTLTFEGKDLEPAKRFLKHWQKGAYDFN
ncbi:MAG: hypothetical protein ACXADY_27350 [Candidatus Hodarchaeales archaeon]|jgi:hypothetical protein